MKKKSESDHLSSAQNPSNTALGDLTSPPAPVPTPPLLPHWPPSRHCSELPSQGLCTCCPWPRMPVSGQLRGGCSFPFRFHLQWHHLRGLPRDRKTSIPLDTEDLPLTIPLPNLTLTLSVPFHIFIYFAILQGMYDLSSLTRD